MIEIVFNNLTFNSLKAAQKYGEGKYPGGYSFITYYNEDGSLMTENEAKEAENQAELEEAKRWAEATPLGGNPNDVFDMSMNLNIGDISCWDNLEKRIDSFGSFKYDQEGYDVKDYEKRNQEYVLEDLKSIIERLKAGEDARIWYGDSTGETLGFEWLMWSFKRADVPTNGLLVNHTKSWYKTKPGDWHKFIAQAVPVTSDMIELSSSKWEKHMAQNAMLRIMEDGTIKEATESYYDALILEEAAKLNKDGEGFQENWLIGALSEREYEIPNYWFYTRIEKMIQDGRFQLVKTAEDGWPKSWKTIK